MQYYEGVRRKNAIKTQRKCVLCPYSTIQSTFFEEFSQLSVDFLDFVTIFHTFFTFYMIFSTFSRIFQILHDFSATLFDNMHIFHEFTMILSHNPGQFWNCFIFFPIIGTIWIFLVFSSIFAYFSSIYQDIVSYHPKKSEFSIFFNFFFYFSQILHIFLQFSMIMSHPPLVFQFCLLWNSSFLNIVFYLSIFSYFVPTNPSIFWFFPRKS